MCLAAMSLARTQMSTCIRTAAVNNNAVDSTADYWQENITAEDSQRPS